MDPESDTSVEWEDGGGYDHHKDLQYDLNDPYRQPGWTDGLYIYGYEVAAVVDELGLTNPGIAGTRLTVWAFIYTAAPDGLIEVDLKIDGAWIGYETIQSGTTHTSIWFSVNFDGDWTAEELEDASIRIRGSGGGTWTTYRCYCLYVEVTDIPTPSPSVSSPSVSPPVYMDVDGEAKTSFHGWIPDNWTRVVVDHSASPPLPGLTYVSASGGSPLYNCFSMTDPGVGATTLRVWSYLTFSTHTLTKLGLRVGGALTGFVVPTYVNTVVGGWGYCDWSGPWSAEILATVQVHLMYDGGASGTGDWVKCHGIYIEVINE